MTTRHQISLSRYFSNSCSHSLVTACLLAAIGCSGSDPLTGQPGTGGTVGVGGTNGAGGGTAPANGGAPAGGSVQSGTGGAPASGGKSAGGSNATGGVVTSTGGSNSGGSSTSGGAVQTGGKSPTGGASAAGGTTTGGKAAGGTPTGGTTTATGGGNATGGVTAAGGAPTGGKAAGGTATTGGAATGGTTATGGGSSCPFPTSFKWKDNGGPIATPANGWVSIKDFTNVLYNGQHIIYSSTHDTGTSYGSQAMAPFTNWSEAATAVQTKMTTSTVAPELMYFTPKSTWVLSYQWCAAKFCYGTSTDPTKANGWSLGKSLLTENITSGSSTGPIDQVVICDSANCYLFYADDNGHIYRASMAIGSFPANFSGSQLIMTDTKANLFEAVEVYTVKGTGEYLMIVEAMGSGGRYFRAFRSTSLGGTFTAIAGASSESTPFAGKNNVTFTSNWTNDISHGDLVRSHDETRTIDPCNLQFLYQGKDPSTTASYDLLPYRLGLLTKTN